MTTIAVIIVNWNGKQYLEQCLASLQQQNMKDFTTIVVDNGSVDGSVTWLEKHHPDVRCIPLKKNTGFAYANNLGIRAALASPDIQYILTLNNDTVLAQDFIEKMHTCAKQHPQAASIQGKVLKFRATNIIDCTGILIYPDMSAMNRGQYEVDRGQFDNEEEIFGASASAALYRRGPLQSVAMPRAHHYYFDNDYFAYFEDVDLAWRLRLSGYTSWYTPSAILFHHHSATGVSHSPFKALYIHRNHYYNIIKNLPLPFLIVAFLFMPIRYLLLIGSVLRKKGPSAELAKKASSTKIATIVLRAWRDVVVALPGLLQKRAFIQHRRVVSLREIWHWMKIYRADLKKIIFS